MVHSGAAIAHLAQMDYTGPNSLFIRVLLDKKYALPYKVVDALVFHFIRSVLTSLPVLAFARRVSLVPTSLLRPPCPSVLA